MSQADGRPFLDANILFSGLDRPLGNPGRILGAHAEGRIHGVFTPYLLQEVFGVMERIRPTLTPLLHRFLDASPFEIWPDPDASDVQLARAWINRADAPILAAVIASRADCLVTGNVRDFTHRVARNADVRILTPAEYVASLDRD